MAITHKYTLVCDDVRQENSGKFIIIGLYTGSMGVPQIPCALPFLTFFMVIEADRLGNTQFQMRLENMETGQRLVEGMGVLGVQRIGMGGNAIRVGPLQINALGTYNFVVTLQGQDPIVTSFEVELRPPSLRVAVQHERR